MSLHESPRPGDRVGAWECRERLGAGGMGEVWLVERAGGAIRQRGALKRLHEGAEGDEVIARFWRERQILASIEHAAIARLIDGGVDDDGRPFLVMEYVEGESIDDWCRARRTGMRERVALLAEVARAIDVAHEHRVVHRDLKPSNVLVDLRGRPHLIDFGIAKILDPAKDTGLVTRDVTRYLTPLFASPEQFSGTQPTTASDVYSLGALAYRLLVGRSAIELLGLGPAEAVRRVIEVQPRPPSAAARVAAKEDEGWADERSAPERQSVHALAGDLDAILLRCLRKEPARRYGRAGEVADDLDRWLAGEPVLARRDTVGYRARRFVMRHRGVVGVTCLLFALLAGGLGVTLGQRAQIASTSAELEARRARSEHLAGDLLASIRGLSAYVYPDMAVIPGTERVLADVTRSLAAIASAQEDPRLLAEAIRIRHLYAYNAWSPFLRTGSRPEDVARSVGAARTMGLGLVARPDATSRGFQVTAEALDHAAWYRYYMGELGPLQVQAKEDEAWLRGLMRQGPNDPLGGGSSASDAVQPSSARERVASAWMNLRIARANGLAALGDLRAALELMLETLEVAEGLEFRNRINRAMLATDLDRLRDGARALQVRLGLLELRGPAPVRGAGHGDRLDRMANTRLTELRAVVDSEVRDGQLEEARRTVLLELNALGDAVDSDAPFEPPSKERAWVRQKLAEVELDRDHPEEAMRHARVAMDELLRCVEGRPTAWVEDLRLNAVRRFCGYVTALGGDREDGVGLLESALSGAVGRLEREERDWYARRTAVDVCIDLASLHDPGDERRRWLDRAAEYLDAGPTDSPDSVDISHRRARIERLR